MFDLIKGFLAGLTFYQSRVLKGMFREGVKLLGVFSVAIWGSLFFEELLLVLNWYLTEATKWSEGDKTGYSFNKLQRNVFLPNEGQGHHQVRRVWASGAETWVQNEAPCCQNSVTLWHSSNLHELYFPNLCQRGWYLPCGFLEHRDQGRTHNGPGAGQEPAQRQQSVRRGSSSSPCFPVISKSLCDGATWTRPGLVLGRLFALPALAGSRGGGVKTLQHLIMKAKSLFMFETT